MKKILSVIMAVFILSSMLSVTAMATDTDLFDVVFEPMSKTFTVSASDGLTGINRVLLLVKNSDNNVVYMNAMNDAEAQDVYFSVDLGKYLEAGEYTFILSSDGDTRSSQTKTCTAEFEEEADFFNVVYNEATNSFDITGEIKKEDDSEAVNRILLMVYDPMFNGYSDLYYMDALNAHKGAFTFNVPLSSSAPVGTYTFVISSDGDVVTKGNRTCAITDNFETYGSISQGTTFGGIYTLEENEAVPTVIIALYNTNKDGSKTLVRTAVGKTAVDGKVTAVLSIAADEDISTYSAKAFVWENIPTSFKPVKTGRSFR